MDYQLGDRIEYWDVTLEDGRTVHRGTIDAIWPVDRVLAVREDYHERAVLIPMSDVIRLVSHQSF
jgi:hypothetical protein